MAIVSPRAGKTAYPVPPIDWVGEPEQWIRKVVETVRGIMNGKINATGTITLTINVASSTLTDLRIGPNSVIHFMPTTANAAAEIGNGTLYVSSRGKQTATITHANNAQADRTFAYSVLG